MAENLQILLKFLIRFVFDDQYLSKKLPLIWLRNSTLAKRKAHFFNPLKDYSFGLFVLMWKKAHKNVILMSASEKPWKVSHSSVIFQLDVLNLIFFSYVKVFLKTINLSSRQILPESNPRILSSFWNLSYCLTNSCLFFVIFHQFQAHWD